MIDTRTFAWAAAVAVAAATGWFARGQATPVGPAPLRLATAPVGAHAAAATTPLIAVSSDGNVTLRVEQQPLEWVLEEIAKQSGRSEVRMQKTVASSPSAATDDTAPACDGVTPVPRLPPADVARLMHAIERGSESDRFDGLLQARGDAITVPQATLRTMYETDASERVRLAAFETWLEVNGDRPDATRSALEAALLLPSEALQREARRRLDELNDSERVDPADPQIAAP